MRENTLKPKKGREDPERLFEFFHPIKGVEIQSSSFNFPSIKRILDTLDALRSFQGGRGDVQGKESYKTVQSWTRHHGVKTD